MYVDEDGTTMDMTKLEKKRWRGKWILGVSLVLLLCGAAALGGFWLFRRDFSSAGGVALTVHIDDRVASGDVVEIEVIYENKKNVDLVVGDIEFFYPDGFYFQSSSVDPVDENGRVWDVGSVAAGAGGKIRLTGQLVGAKDEVKEFAALWTYQPKNFSQDFQERVSATTTITSSLAELSLDVPKQVQSDQEFTITVNYKNTSPAPLQNVKLLFTPPEKWVMTSADPQPSRENNDWRFERLEPGAKGKIVMKGKLDGSSGDTKEFHVQFGLVEIDNSFNVQLEERSLVVIANPEVQLSLTMPDVAKAGTDIPLTVNIQNISEAVLNNVMVTLTFDGQLASAKEQTIEDIKKLNPQEKVERQLTTKIKSDTILADQSIRVVARISSATVGGHTVTFPNEAEATTKIEGDFTILAEARYFDDDLKKIGSGPLPPMVNHNTTYVVWWTITNGANTIDELSLTTTLPADVIWGGNASSSIVYDAVTRTVSLKAKEFAAFGNQRLAFSVTVSPTNEDLDTLLILTGETVINGRNAFTGKDIAFQQKRLTSELTSDEGAAGKGVVAGDTGVIE